MKLMKKTIEFDGIGPVVFQRSVRARRLIISIRPFRGVRVTVPRGVAWDRSIRFFESKRGWVQEKLAGMAQRETAIRTFQNRYPIPDRFTARAMIVTRLNALADAHGFKYNRVFIRNQTTRWGSCSAQNNINLNIQLAALEPELMDYVILHELLHIRIKNHGPAFWDALHHLVPDAAAKRRQLQEMSALLIQ